MYANFFTFTDHICKEMKLEIIVVLDMFPENLFTFKTSLLFIFNKSLHRPIYTSVSVLGSCT